MANKKRLMADLSATIIHGGHIRLLKRAREEANARDATVVVGLTSDQEIERNKGYTPELNFDERKEIVETLIYVDEVVKTPWLITEEVLIKHEIDFLFHGDDNVNPISEEKLILVPRTPGISTTDLRLRTIKAHGQMKNRKSMFVPEFGETRFESISNVFPMIGKGKEEYLKVKERVLSSLRRMTGHRHIVCLQGSAALAAEIAVRNFIAGRVLVVDIGYYSNRLIRFCETVRDFTGRISELKIIPLEEFLSGGCTDLSGKFDWILSVYAETKEAVKSDIYRLIDIKKYLGARLFLDASASVGLENSHEAADVITYSSSRGLFSITGAAFIAWNGDPPNQKESSFCLNIKTYRNKMMTEPYQAIAALDRLLPVRNELKEKVLLSKKRFVERFGPHLVHPEELQPLIATQLSVELRENLDYSTPCPVGLYTTDSVKPGHSIVCHLYDLATPFSEVGSIYSQLMVVEIEE